MTATQVAYVIWRVEYKGDGSIKDPCVETIL